MSDEKPMSPEPAVPDEAMPASVIEALPAPAPMAALPPPTPNPRHEAADRLLDTCRASLASIGASQTAIASEVTAMTLEMSRLARSNLTAAGDSITALLRAKSLGDMVEIQFGFARRSLDTMIEGSTRLGEFGLRLANDAAKPMFERFSAR